MVLHVPADGVDVKMVAVTLHQLHLVKFTRTHARAGGRSRMRAQTYTRTHAHDYIVRYARARTQARLVTGWAELGRFRRGRPRAILDRVLIFSRTLVALETTESRVTLAGAVREGACACAGAQAHANTGTDHAGARQHRPRRTPTHALTTQAHANTGPGARQHRHLPRARGLWRGGW